MRPGTPVQAHVAIDDPFAPPGAFTALEGTAARAGVRPELHRYPGAGHFFTDEQLPDHDPVAAALAWQRIGALLDRLR